VNLTSLTPLEWTPVVGALLYLANVALGAGLQLRLWRLHRARWVHHALYFLVCVASALAAYGLWASERRWWPLLLTGACLAVLPRARGGSGQHMALTFTGLVGYALVLV
jgi:hypothetical protein